jgi:hypothetical protein
MGIKSFARKFGSLIQPNKEAELLALGALLSKQQLLIRSDDINDYEFKIFSQWGDDGIIQYLVRNIRIVNKTFIEFGVQDYTESNTRFLLMNDNWRGFVMDGSQMAMARLKNRDWFWKFDLDCKAVFIDKDNINPLLDEIGFSSLGLLHIDLDGNDYHIFKKIDLGKLNPSIIILEYNSLFGKDRMISVPYDKNFQRTRAHYSNLYFGASLGAFEYWARKSGYSLVCSNLAGNNAYFVRNDLLNQKVRSKTVGDSYKISNFREGRNTDGTLSFLSGEKKYEVIKGMRVVNVVTDELEML